MSLRVPYGWSAVRSDIVLLIIATGLALIVGSYVSRASPEPWRGMRPMRTSDMVLLIIAAGLVVVIGTYVLSALR